MEFPLTNITHPTMQTMNRSGSYAGESPDMCSPMSAPSGGSSPVYGPTVSTAHEQFVNVGPVDPNGAGQRKNQGQRKNNRNNQHPRNPNNASSQQQQHSRGLSPTNSQPYASMIPNPRSQPEQQQAPIGSESANLQQQQQQQIPQESMMDADELEYQRLEEFAMLQQQLQMMQYSNEAMMGYFSQMGMPMPYSSGGSPMGGMHAHHLGAMMDGGMSSHGGSPMSGMGPMDGHHHMGGGMMGEQGMPMHNGGFTMPPTDHMAALDYHQVTLQQQQDQQQSQDGGAVYAPSNMQQHQQHVEEVQQPTAVDSTPPSTKQQQRPKLFGTPEPRSVQNSKPHHANSSTEDPCPCMHCHQAKALGTPNQSDRGAMSHGASPEDYTPVPGGSGHKHQQYTTPHRNTHHDRNSTGRRGDRSDRVPFSKAQSRGNQQHQQQQQPHQHHHAHDARELFSAPPQGPTKFKVQVAGHFGRKFHIKSAIKVTKGDYVIFDGDRGVELGEVAEVNSMDAKEIAKNQSQHQENHHHGKHSMPNRRGHELVHRLATEPEILRWKTTLMADAKEATKAAQIMANEHGLSISIRCGSYQFDGKKLTFFYESDQRVDFRKLLSEMFSRYHCRIWMEQTSELAFVPQKEEE